MDSIVCKNYSTDGGDTWVVGGRLVIEEGAEVEGLGGASQGGHTVGAVDNQSASTATAVAGLKNDFNALLNKLKNAGIMMPDAWNITAGLAPTPTEEVLVANKEKVQSVTLAEGVITVTVDVNELTESASSDPNQGTHKWVALEIGTGISDITGVKLNGAALTEQDVNDAQATGCASGSFVLYIRAEEAAETPVAFTLWADGYGEIALTIQVAAPDEDDQSPADQGE